MTDLIPLLEMLLKAQDVMINTKSLTKVIATYELVKVKGEDTSLKDVLELQENKK